MSDPAHQHPSVAIIGAGIAGLACASRLVTSGLTPVVFEKSRGVAGRISTRRVNDTLSFDHGAQYVTARSPDFREFLGHAVSRGAVELWRPRLSDGHPCEEAWWVGSPTMNALVKPLATDVDVRLTTEIATVRREADGYWFDTVDDQKFGPFDIAVCTAPAPQAQRLLQSFGELSDALASVAVDPCWALMVAFDTRQDVSFDAMKSDGPIAWAARSGSKPDRASEVDAWVFHASPSWSREHLELDKDAAAKAMLEFLPAYGLTVGAPVHAAAHRWRYARTATPLGRQCLTNADGALLVGGDWCLGARIECAFESGQAIADTILRGVNA